jgi:hypothetical protein
MRLGSVVHVEEANRSDLDSHADCCVCGKEVLVFNDFDREVTIMSFICASVINHDITKVMGQ